MKTGNFGYNLNQIRLRWGMSQKELGIEIGLTLNQIQKYINKGQNPSLDILFTIVLLSGVPFFDLYGKKLDMADIPPAPVENGSGPFLKHESDVVKELKEEIMVLLKENRDLRIEIDELKNT